MMKRFNDAFGIHDDLPSEQRRFVERINQTAFLRVKEIRYNPSATEIFGRVGYVLGINADDMLREANSMNFSSEKFVPHLRTLTNNDFRQTLKVICVVYDVLRGHPGHFGVFCASVQAALQHATVDLGIRWTDGMFYPSGAPELDTALVEEPLVWLTDYPNERADYTKALAAYSGKRLDDVVINCYVAVEGIARAILSNTRTLENNREDLMKQLSLSQPWKALLSNFINYANEFGRHASQNRHDLNPVEVEGFLYMTGVVIRMCVLSA